MKFKNRWSNANIQPYEKPSPEEVREMLEQIQSIVEKFCETVNVDFSRIEINARSLEDVVIRTDMRNMYFAVFHKGMIPNEYKRIIGLLVFWILKLHPFWISIRDEDDGELMNIASHINEKISVFIVISLLHEYNPDFLDKGKDLCEGYIRELEYSFTYRDLSKESLFLMFDPFYYMHSFEASVKGSCTFF